MLSTFLSCACLAVTVARADTMLSTFLSCACLVVTVARADSDETSVPPPPYLPVVLWHGMWDTCCEDDSTTEIHRQMIVDVLPSIYVHRLRLGRNKYLELLVSVSDANKQVEKACQLIRDDPNLAGGYNAVGFSQAGQLMRAVAQRCPEPRMYNLVTMGAQHQGIYGLDGAKCFFNLMKRISYGYVTRYIFIASQYWHDPLDEERYRKRSTFLADINNERNDRPKYKENLLRLNKFVMVKYSYDSQVIPKDSAWFGFYTPGQAKKITKLEDSPIFIHDLIGLKTLKNTGRLIFAECPGDHLANNGDWFKRFIVKRYLAINISELTKN